MRVSAHAVALSVGRTLALMLLSVPALSLAASDDARFTLLLENDAVADTDYHYTNGLLLSYTTTGNKTPAILQRLGQKLPGIGAGDSLVTSVHLGHQIYTPKDLKAKHLLRDQRPYAGYLFGGISYLGVSPTELSHWTLNVGVVGPKSRGESLHKSVHRRLGHKSPQGWEHQLGNEAIIQLDYQHIWRYARLQSRSGYQIETFPYMDLALGNAHTHAEAGFMTRIGKGNYSDFSPPRARPNMSSSTAFDLSGYTGWYWFGGVGGRYVAHNIFLDGNTNQDSHSVDKRDWVGELQTGLVWESEGYRVTFTYVHRSAEYRAQKSADKFGSLMLSVNF